MPPSLAIRADPWNDALLQQRATALAAQLGYPIAQRGEAKQYDLLLVAMPTGLELRVLNHPDPTLIGGHPVGPDWSEIDLTSPAGRSLQQPLFKAVGLRKRSDAAKLDIVDATAGLGEDAWMLAATGCRVRAVERHPVLAAMLAEAALRSGVGDRLTIHCADAAAWLEALPVEEQPAIVCLDPMFPTPPGGRRAAERKPMRILRQLVGEDADAQVLFLTALRTARRRVVVKRPRLAPPLAAGTQQPVHRVIGKGFRIDVYSTLR